MILVLLVYQIQNDIPACRYGTKCYQTNPNHLKQFSHPEGHSPYKQKQASQQSQHDDEESLVPKKKKLSQDTPKEKVQVKERAMDMNQTQVVMDWEDDGPKKHEDDDDEDNDNVAQLRELFPNVSEKKIKQILAEKNNDLEAALNILGEGVESD